MKCDHLIGRTFNGEVYVLASEAMEAIAELKKKLQDEHDFGLHIARCADHDDEKRYAEIAQLQAMLEERNREVGELKANLEDAKATAYAESVDAGMRERRLRRALWLARAERAIAEAEYWYGHTSGMYYIDAMDVPDDEDDPYKRVKDTTIGWYKTWMKVERKCRAKAEEYK